MTVTPLHFDLGTFLAFLPLILMCLRYLRKIDQRGARTEALMRDFPPHRHIGDRVVFPAEFRPSTVEYGANGKTAGL